MDKAVRWAIYNTTSATPSTTVFVLPKWQYTTYRNWLLHPNVKEYCTVNRHFFPFKTGDHWHLPSHMAYAKDPKWDVKIFVVTNEPRFMGEESVERFKQLFLNTAEDRLGNRPECKE